MTKALHSDTQTHALMPFTIAQKRVHEAALKFPPQVTKLNLAYRILSWKIYIPLIKAKLEPYLGFVPGMQKGEPSLVCDFQELYRYFIDDFVVEYCRTVRTSDFVLKDENHSTSPRGKRQYLSEAKNRDLLDRLNRYFEKRVAIPRIRARATIHPLT